MTRLRCGGGVWFRTWMRLLPFNLVYVCPPAQVSVCVVPLVLPCPRANLLAAATRPCRPDAPLSPRWFTVHSKPLAAARAPLHLGRFERERIDGGADA